MNPIGGMLLARFSSVLFTLGYLCTYYDMRIV